MVNFVKYQSRAECRVQSFSRISANAHQGRGFGLSRWKSMQGVSYLPCWGTCTVTASLDSPCLNLEDEQKSRQGMTCLPCWGKCTGTASLDSPCWILEDENP